MTQEKAVILGAEYFEDMEEHPRQEEELMPTPGMFKKSKEGCERGGGWVEGGWRGQLEQVCFRPGKDLRCHYQLDRKLLEGL